jgi:hypothetical protein
MSSAAPSLVKDGTARRRLRLVNLGQNLIGEQACGQCRLGPLSSLKSRLNRYPLIQQPFGAEITP